MDELSLMDAANLPGATAGVVGAGYAGAAYHQQRKQEKEDCRRMADVEINLKRNQGTQAGISIEDREPDVEGFTRVRALEEST